MVDDNIDSAELGAVTMGTSDMIGGPSGPSTLGAAFRQSNMVASTLSSPVLWERVLPQDQTPMDTDALIARMEEDGIFDRRHEKHFLEVRTRGEYEAMKRQLDMETADRKVLDDNWATGLGAQVLAGVFDLPTLVPAARLVQIVRGGAGAVAGSRALGVGVDVGLASGLDAAVSELGLHGSQVLRTPEETLLNVGGATLLGGVLGYGGARFVYRGDPAEKTRLEGALNHAWTEWIRPTPEASQIATDVLARAQRHYDEAVERLAGDFGPNAYGIVKARELLDAAEARVNAIDDTTPLAAGPLEWFRTKALRAMSAMSPSWLDPIDTALRRSASPTMRSAVEKLVDMPLLLNKHIDGEASPVSAVTAKESLVGRWAEASDMLYGEGIGRSQGARLGLGESFYARWLQSKPKEPVDGVVRQGEVLRAGETPKVWRANRESFEQALFRALINGDVDPDGNMVITEAAAMLRKRVIEPLRERAEKLGLPVGDGVEVMGAISYMPRRYDYEAITKAPDHFKSLLRAGRFAAIRAEHAAVGGPFNMNAALKEAREFAEAAFDSITKANVDDIINPMWRKGAEGSALKARVVPVADNVLFDYGFIKGDVSNSLASHVEEMSKAIALAERFGADDMKLSKLSKEIEGDYDKLIADLEKTTPDAKQRQAEVEKLRKSQERDTQMLKDLVDAFIGSSSPLPTRLTGGEMLVQGVKTYQATRLMGSLFFASIPELANVIVRQGPGKLARSLFMQTADSIGLGSELSRMSATEAKRFGGAVEWALNATHVETAGGVHAMSNPAANAFASRMQRYGKFFAASTGNLQYTNFLKKVAWRSATDRILQNAERGWARLSKTEQAEMARQGIDEAGLNRIGAAWRSQPVALHDGFLRHAQMTDWDDEVARDLMSGAILKEVTSTIITPRVGDAPVIFHQATGGARMTQLMLQFTRFTFAQSAKSIAIAEQRVRANPFSLDAARVYLGTAAFVSLGMLAEILWRHAADTGSDAWGSVFGRDDMPARKVEKLEGNFGALLARGIERSGVTGMVGMANTYAERSGVPGIGRLLQHAYQDKSLEQEHRGAFLARNPIVNFAGPTFSQFGDAISTAPKVPKAIAYGLGLAGEHDARFSDIKTARQIMPFQNHVIMRGFFDAGERAVADWLDVAIPASR